MISDFKFSKLEIRVREVVVQRSIEIGIPCFFQVKSLTFPLSAHAPSGSLLEERRRWRFPALAVGMLPKTAEILAFPFLGFRSRAGVSAMELGLWGSGKFNAGPNCEPNLAFAQKVSAETKKFENRPA